jgi:hypothetical protein
LAGTLSISGTGQGRGEGVAFALLTFAIICTIGGLASGAWWLRSSVYEYSSTAEELRVAKRGVVIERYPWREVDAVRLRGQFGLRDLFQPDAGVSMLPTIDILDTSGWHRLPPIAAPGRRGRQRVANRLQTTVAMYGVRFSSS